MKILPRFLAAALLAGLAHGSARADQLYGVTLLDNQLFTVDTATGAGSLVGPIGPVGPFGLATQGDRLLTFDSTAGLIRQLDPATGGTQATYNINIGPVLGQGGLAFQDANVGFLTTALDPSTFAQANDLYRFDLSTGTTTLVAQTSDTIEALAFGPNGTLYGLGKLDGNLYTLDPSTGASVLVGNVGVSIGSPTGGLAFAPDGTLYATLDDALYTLSSTTGLATPVNPDPTSFTGFSSISGLAFVRAVPEPSSLALVGLGVAALFRKARARRPA